jgi:hypothetical protein
MMMMLVEDHGLLHSLIGLQQLVVIVVVVVVVVVELVVIYCTSII